MKTKILITVLVGLLVISVISVGLVAAKSDNPGQGEKPAMAGRPEKLEQIIFVHPVAPDRPDSPGKGKPPKPPVEPKDNTYYELWGGWLDGTATYYVNPTVSLVAGEDPVAAVNAAVEAWDEVTAANLFEYGGETTERWYAEDGQNTVSWVKFVPRNYIAVAVMWYDPATMIIYEIDIVFNTFFAWGIDPDREGGVTIKAMDIQNIATHEFGHPTGLDDLYNEIYSELTMYGYSSKGETQKCTLEEGDISGAQSIYGP